MWEINKSIRDDFVHHLEAKKRYSFASLFPNKELTNPKDIQFAVYSAYECGVPFQTGRQSYKTYNKAPFNYQSCLDNIAERIYKYFNNQGNQMNDQNNFDIFHNELCSLFLSLNTSRRGKEFTYGNAQKLINMVFKYLSCFKDYNQFADLFSYCHIPIDGYILDALGGAHMASANKKQYNGRSWTKFTCWDYFSLVSEYRRNRKKLIKSSDLSFLALDFYVWQHSVKKCKLKLPVTGTTAKHIPNFYK